MGSSNHICRRIAGFTLIELLAAMSVLVLITLMMARVYTDTTRMWELGTRRVTSAAEGRAVMDFLVRELAMAIADDVVAFRTVSPGVDGETFIYGTETYGAEADEIFFVGMVRRGNTGSYRRTANQFAYFVTEMLDENDDILPYRYRLVRTRKTSTVFSRDEHRVLSAYGTNEWWKFQLPNYENIIQLPSVPPAERLYDMETIAENVAAFEIWSYSERAGEYVSNYRSVREGNRLPIWVDIYLEMLSEADAIRAADLFESGVDAEARAFVDNQARRYMARVFFANRERAKAFDE
jgi:prepilin-type N-terminal cleavage/methylation domain-containing protein